MDSIVNGVAKTRTQLSNLHFHFIIYKSYYLVMYIVCMYIHFHVYVYIYTKFQ